MFEFFLNQVRVIKNTYKEIFIGLFNPPFCVLALVVINVLIWFISIHVFDQYYHLKESSKFFKIFALQEPMIWERLWLWQFISYQFLHASIGHLGINMICLILFGSFLERIWGYRFFLSYYLFCGIGGGFIFCCVRWFYIFGFGGEMPDYMREATGASASVLGLLAAFFLIYGRKPISFPTFDAKNFRLKYIKLLYLFPVLIIPDILGLIKMIKNGMTSAIGHEAHLGGMLFGLIFLFLWKFFQKKFYGSRP